MTAYWDTIGQPGPVGDYTIHSCDTHLVEPRDLWTTRLGKEFRDRAPQVQRLGGRDWWFCEGLNLMHCGHAASRWDPDKYTGRYEDQRPGGMLPDRCVADSDLDGVDVNVFFPSAPITFYRIPDARLLQAIFRAYDDWVADFCSYDPRRLKGVATLVLPEDIEGAVAELERCVKKGFVGGQIPMLSAPDPTYDDPVYDPLWAAAQEMQAPLMMHTGGNRSTQAATTPVGMAMASGAPRPPAVGKGASDASARDNIAAMIYGGVFERFPRLQVGCMEMGTGWVPYFIRVMDRSYVVRRGDGPRAKTFKDGMAPGDFVRRNVFFSYQDEDLGILTRDIISVDNLMYANDYPHPDCVWPRSRTVLERMYAGAGCTEQEKAKLAGGNAARIFRLEAARPARAAASSPRR
ncbi:MAG: amidohydrolase [SAR202 cluster bacterium]|nr:amidohydrolase [SAR202 cluster bacterium]